MGDRLRYEKVNDQQLEDLVAALPRREPYLGVRARVLAGARAAAFVRPPAPRTAFAVVALVLLVVADVAALSWQDTAFGARPAPPPAVAGERMVAFSAAPAALAGLIRAAEPPQVALPLPTARDSYWQLQRAMQADEGRG